MRRQHAFALQVLHPGALLASDSVGLGVWKLGMTGADPSLAEGFCDAGVHGLERQS